MVPKPNNILEIPNHLQSNKLSDLWLCILLGIIKYMWLITEPASLVSVQIVTLTGYTDRFMFLVVSHEGKTNAPGAGDETFRFWNVFPPKKAQIKRMNLFSLTK